MMFDITSKPFTDAMAALGLANPEAQGLPCGDNVDSTSAFVSALSVGRGAIVVPPSTFRIGPIRLPDDSTIRGFHGRRYYAFDKGPLRGQSRLVPLHGLTSGESLIDIQGVRGVTIEAVCLDGEDRLNSTIDGISGGSHDLTIDGCSIGRFRNGLGAEGNPLTTIARIVRSEFTVNVRSGIAQLTDSDVTDCELTANGSEGLLQIGAPSVNITATRVEWNGRYGIHLTNADSIQVLGGLFDANGGQGVRTDQGCSRIGLTGVQFRRNGRKDDVDKLSAHISLAESEKVVISACGFSHGVEDTGAPPDTPTVASLVIASGVSRLLLVGNDFTNGTAGNSGSAVRVIKNPKHSRAIGNIGFGDVAERAGWKSA